MFAAADDFGATGGFNEAAFKQRLHRAVNVHAADLLDLGARDGLAIRDDGERLQRRLREPRRADFHADERAQPLGKFRLR